MKKNWRRISGISLLEIIITLVIISVLTTLGVITLGGSRNQQNLVITANEVVDTIRRAQSDASSNRKYRAVCFKQGSTGTPYLQVYEPAVAANGLPTNIDCDGTDVSLGYKLHFKPYISVCANCDANIALNKSIFFDKNGFSVLNTGARTSFQICLIHDKLASGTRAREVEVNSLGVTKLLKLGETSDLTSVVANSGNCI